MEKSSFTVATFAYFSVSVQGTNSSTTVTGKTPELATLTYITGSENAYLRMAAGDMSEPTENTKYYATITETSTDSENGGVWLKETSSAHEDDKAINLGGVSLTTTGNETYSCTYTITLTKEDTDDMVEQLQTGDMILNISGGITDGTNYDLTGLKTSGTKTFTTTFDLTKSDNSKSFDATLYFVNKTTTQNELVNKTLNLKFTPSATCEIAKEAD